MCMLGWKQLYAHMRRYDIVLTRFPCTIFFKLFECCLLEDKGEQAFLEDVEDGEQVHGVLHDELVVHDDQAYDDEQLELHDDHDGHALDDAPYEQHGEFHGLLPHD